MATFGAGQIPHVRLELSCEEPSLTHQASRSRAKKHETNALRAAPTPSPTTYASAVAGTSPGPNRQLITSMAKLEKAISSNLTAARGRERRVTFEPATYGSTDKRGRSPGSDAGRSRKPKVTSGDECDYPMCRHRNSHSRPDCRLAKMHERDGIVVTKKP